MNHTTNTAYAATTPKQFVRPDKRRRFSPCARRTRTSDSLCVAMYSRGCSRRGAPAIFHVNLWDVSRSQMRSTVAQRIHSTTFCRGRARFSLQMVKFFRRENHAKSWVHCSKRKTEEMEELAGTFQFPG